MTAQTRSEIAALLQVHGLKPIHRLGQHFLADANITRKIVALAELGPGDRVVEVGAGTGTLTRALASTGAQVLSFEIDERLRPVLSEVTDGLDVAVRYEDISKTDLSIELERPGWVMVSNLPYNVGTPLVLDSLRNVFQIERFVVMVQLEVARRFVAQPGSADYGLPSVVAGLYSTAVFAFKVAPQVFYPAPRVDSAVVLLTRKPASDEAPMAVELARAGFGQRRKMLRRSLNSILDEPEAALVAAGIPVTARAEDLSSDDYLVLARVVS